MSRSRIRHRKRNKGHGRRRPRVTIAVIHPGVIWGDGRERSDAGGAEVLRGDDEGGR